MFILKRIILILHCYSFSLHTFCQQIPEAFEHKEFTTKIPHKPDQYYFSLLPTTISRIILTYYSPYDFGPTGSLQLKIDKALEVHNTSDTALWGSFNITVYKNACAKHESEKSQALVAAIKNEHLKDVHFWLSIGADPNKVTPDCKEPYQAKLCHPMRLAALKGNIPIFLALKAAGGEVYSLVMNDAVESGNLKMVETIFNCYKNRCWSNISCAVNQGNGAILDFLIKNSDLAPLDRDYYGFSYATLVRESIENAGAEITHMLLNVCPSFDINSVDTWYIIGFGRRTERPLNTALRKKKFVLAKDLIQKGAWVNPPPLDNQVQCFDLNPLWLATHDDNVEAIEFLLQNGADPNHLANHNGKSQEGEPIIKFIDGYAHKPNSDKIIQLLHEHASKGKL